MPMVYLIEGPVGAGKSRFSTQLANERQAIHLPLDQWFVALFSPDRPQTDVVNWYLVRKDRLLQTLWWHAQQILASGKDVILEMGLIQAEQRQAFCRQIIAAGFPLTMHVLDASQEVRWQRVQQRNRERGPTYAMQVTETVFEIASQMWQAPDEDECREFDIRFCFSDTPVSDFGVL